MDPNLDKNVGQKFWKLLEAGCRRFASCGHAGGLSCCEFISVITCGFLTIPSNGNVRENGSSVDAVAKFTCNAGYVLIGASSISCQQDGNWSSQTPVCQGKFLLTKDIIISGFFR